MRDPRPSRVRAWVVFACGVLIGAAFLAVSFLVLALTDGDLWVQLRGAKRMQPAWAVVGFAATFALGSWVVSALSLRASLREARAAEESPARG